MKQAMQKNALILAAFAVSCTAMVGLVHYGTKDIIKEQQQKQLLSKLAEIIEPERHNNNIYQDCIIVSEEALATTPQMIYLARNDDQPVAAAISTIAPDGYNGNIELLVAVNVDGSVNGVRTLNHNETPGLGDKIELRKDNWILSFNNKRITDDSDTRWAVAKDGGMFDQFTGATITPRAVVNAVYRAVDYFNKNQQLLFSIPANCRESINVK